MKNLLYYWHLSSLHPFDFAIQSFDEDTCFPKPDLHRDIHLIIVQSGSLRIRNDDEFLLLHPGEFVLTAPWVLHGSNTMTGGTRLFVLTIETEILLEHMLGHKDLLMSLLICPPEIRKECLKNCNPAPLIEKLLKSFDRCKDDDPKIRIMRQWLAIQTFFIDLLSVLAHSDFPVISTENFRKIEPCLSRISEGKPLSVSDAASLCKISVSYFSHIFKQTMRVPFSVYEMHSRLNHAAVRLQQGIPVKMVALEFSFFDPSHFSKVFTRQFGVPPGKFKSGQASSFPITNK